MRTSLGDSFLHLCIKSSHLPLLKFLISMNHPIDVINNEGDTLLHTACSMRNPEIVSYLLQINTSHDIPNSQGDYPIHKAVEFDCKETVKALLDNRIPVDLKTARGETSLHLAIDINSLEMIEYLISMHANIELADNNCNRPIHLACKSNKLQILQLFLTKKVRLDLCNDRNETPLSISIRHGSSECLFALLEAGVSIREEDIRLARAVSSPSIWQHISAVFKDQNHFSPKLIEEDPCAQHLTVEEETLPQLQERIQKLTRDNEKLSEKLLRARTSNGVEEIDGIDLAECIGRGEYGEVYKATWRYSEVAVKKFYNVDEFNDEAGILMNIRHPNIVLFMALCRNPPLIVTEYMDLGNLSTVIGSAMVLSRKQLVGMAVDIARGLVFLHSASPSIVHRDLKSANCLVDSRLCVKICDFGLAQAKNNTLKDTEAFGTFPYMAPEVITQQKYSVKSDVYAFGILLWEIVNRQRPFAELAPVQIVYQVVHAVNLI